MLAPVISSTPIEAQKARPIMTSVPMATFSRRIRMYRPNTASIVRRI